MKPRIRLIIDHAEGHCTEVEIEGPKVTSAMLEAAEDLVQTLTTGERPVFKLLYDLTARAFNTTSEDAKVRITAATYGMSAPKIEEASAHKAASSWNGEESEARKTLRQLAIRLQEEVPDRWELQTSNSFWSVGTSRADGRVLRGTTQRHDGHPDLQGAPGVLAYIIAAQPLVVTSLLEDLDAAEEKLRALHVPGVTVTKGLTVDTITDEQIRELRKALMRESGGQMTDDTDLCGNALWYDGPLRQIARFRCVEILNARNERGDDEFPRTAYYGPHERSCYCPECK